MAPCPRTMMFSSHMAGTYAPPAVAGRRAVLVAALGGERHQLEEGQAGIEEALDPLAHEEAAALLVAPPRLGGAALAHARQALAQLGGEPAVVARVRLELPVAADPRYETAHERGRPSAGALVLADEVRGARREPRGRLTAARRQPREHWTGPRVCLLIAPSAGDVSPGTRPCPPAPLR